MRAFIDIINESYSQELTAKNFGDKLKAKMLTDSTLASTGMVASFSEIMSPKGSLMTPEAIIEYFSQFDPSKKKFYLRNWIIPRYLSGGIAHLDDLPGVKHDLAKYRELLNHMPVKDIRQVATAVDLARMVRKAMADLSSQNGLSVPKEEAEAATRESTIIADVGGFLIVIPETERAAGYWGRHSEWCTAYGYKYGINPSKTSQYNDYMSDDGVETKLLIFYDKNARYDSRGNREGDDRSIQCSYGQDGTQIADIDDDKFIDLPRLRSYFALIPELVIDACVYDPDIRYITGKGLCQYADSLSEFIEKFGTDEFQMAERVVVQGESAEQFGLDYGATEMTPEQLKKYFFNKLKKNGVVIDSLNGDVYRPVNFEQYMSGTYKDFYIDWLRKLDSKK